MRPWIQVDGGVESKRRRFHPQHLSSCQLSAGQPGQGGEGGEGGGQASGLVLQRRGCGPLQSPQHSHRHFLEAGVGGGEAGGEELLLDRVRRLVAEEQGGQVRRSRWRRKTAAEMGGGAPGDCGV